MSVIYISPPAYPTRVRITPSTIPNRDSLPQNHPSPIDAVSNMDGATVSIGGMPFLMPFLMEGSLVFDSWPIAGSMVCEQAHKNNIEPNRMYNHPLLMWSLFFITPKVQILEYVSSFRSPIVKIHQMCANRILTTSSGVLPVVSTWVKCR